MSLRVGALSTVSRAVTRLSGFGGANKPPAAGGTLGHREDPQQVAGSATAREEMVVVKGVMRLGQLGKIKAHEPRSPGGSNEAGFSKPGIRAGEECRAADTGGTM